MQKLLILILLSFPVLLGTASTVLAHGEETTIVPKKLVVAAGEELAVSVGGLSGTQVASFTLKGMFGSFDLGTFDIDSDDFTQVLMIPKEAEPGSYSLIVTGGEKRAKEIITVK